MTHQSKTLRFLFFAMIYFAEGIVLGYFASLNGPLFIGQRHRYGKSGYLFNPLP